MGGRGSEDSPDIPPLQERCPQTTSVERGPLTTSNTPPPRRLPGGDNFPGGSRSGGGMGVTTGCQCDDVARGTPTGTRPPSTSPFPPTPSENEPGPTVGAFHPLLESSHGSPGNGRGRPLLAMSMSIMRPGVPAGSPPGSQPTSQSESAPQAEAPLRDSPPAVSHVEGDTLTGAQIVKHINCSECEPIIIITIVPTVWNMLPACEPGHQLGCKHYYVFMCLHPHHGAGCQPVPSPLGRRGGPWVAAMMWGIRFSSAICSAMGAPP